MDVRIENGDVVLHANGDYYYIDGIDEAVQCVRTVLLTGRGTFWYDRRLGVEYNAFSGTEEDPAAKLDMLLKEAAAEIGGVDTEVLSYHAQTAVVRVKVNYHGSSAVTEVDISGII